MSRSLITFLSRVRYTRKTWWFMMYQPGMQSPLKLAYPDKTSAKAALGIIKQGTNTHYIPQPKLFTAVCAAISAASSQTSAPSKPVSQIETEDTPETKPETGGRR